MFQFNLQPLLFKRKFTEKIRKKELAELKRKLEKENEKLLACREREDRLVREMNEKTRQHTSVSELMMYALSHQQVTEHIKRQRDKVDASKAESREGRDRLLNAMKNRKALDRLKEKRWMAYRKEEARKEQAFLSEIAIQQFNRKSD